MQQKIDLTVVIPNYNSPFTSKTIQGVLDNAGCEVEVVVNVEEKWFEPLIEDGRAHYIHHSAPIGMRAGINACVALAKGKYIMKLDDHCLVGKDFGKILIESHQPEWIQVPRRYALDAEKWAIEERTDGKYPVCQMFTDFPTKYKPHDAGTHGVPWTSKRDETKDQDLVESPSIQGSCWFMEKEYFKKLNLMDETGYGSFAQEAQEISLKCWLSGGKVMINKKTFYSHLHKGSRYGRMYKMPGGIVEADAWVARHWVNNEEPNMKHTFKWFIDEKFPNMPTWPSNWEEILREEGTLYK